MQRAALCIDLDEERAASITDPEAASIAVGDACGVESALIEFRRPWLQRLVEIARAVTAGRIGRCRSAGVSGSIRSLQRGQRDHVCGSGGQCERADRRRAVGPLSDQYIGIADRRAIDIAGRRYGDAACRHGAQLYGACRAACGYRQPCADRRTQTTGKDRAEQGRRAGVGCEHRIGKTQDIFPHFVHRNGGGTRRFDEHTASGRLRLLGDGSCRPFRWDLEVSPVACGEAVITAEEINERGEVCIVRRGSEIQRAVGQRCGQCRGDRDAVADIGVRIERHEQLDTTEGGIRKHAAFHTAFELSHGERRGTGCGAERDAADLEGDRLAGDAAAVGVAARGASVPRKSGRAVGEPGCTEIDERAGEYG